MKTKLILLALALGASLSLVTAQDKPAPDGKGPPPQGGPGGPPPQGGPGGGPGVHILPRGAREKLNLSEDQKKQISDLEADTTSKLEKILTPDQMEQLKQMRPQGGPGGPGGGGKGGPGGKQGGGKGGKPPGQPPAQQNN